MMLDVLGALAISAIFTIDIGVLVGLARITPRSRMIAYVAAAAWSVLIVAISAVGGFAPGVLGPVPAPLLPFAVLVIGGLAAWSLWPGFRGALLSVPLAVLVGVNAFRIGGIFFLILYAQDRLAAPFGPSAGWGDTITGLAAIPLAAMIAAARLPSRGILMVWNAFGALDLIVAVTLGVLSAQGAPFRIFMDEPGNVVMTTLPYVGVPAFLVPFYLLTHLTIAAQLRSARAQRSSHTGRDQPVAPPARA
jgi:hypothetical protein